MRRRGDARILYLGVQIAVDDGGSVRRSGRASEGAKLDARGRAGGRRGLLDVDGGLAAMVARDVAVAVGAATHNGGHSGHGGLDAAAVHRRHRGALSMLRVRRASHYRRRCAARDDRIRDLLGRAGVRAAGSGLSRSSGHGGGRSLGGAVRGRSGRGSGDRWGLRVRDGSTHGLGGRGGEAAGGDAQSPGDRGAGGGGGAEAAGSQIRAEGEAAVLESRRGRDSGAAVKKRPRAGWQACIEVNSFLGKGRRELSERFTEEVNRDRCPGEISTGDL